MNQPKTPVEPGFASLNPSLDEVIAEFVSQNPEMAADMEEVMAPDAFEESAYDAALDVYSGKIKEPLADETDRLARQMDYMDWVRNGGVGTQAEFEAMKAAQAPAPRFRPTNYDAAVANGYKGTFSDWLRENASHDYEFREPEPAVPAWHKVVVWIMVVAIIAVLVAVFASWKNYSGDTMVRTKSVIAAGQI